jgi:hypothetical protein
MGQDTVKSMLPQVQNSQRERVRQQNSATKLECRDHAGCDHDIPTFQHTPAVITPAVIML